MALEAIKPEGPQLDLFNALHDICESYAEELKPMVIIALLANVAGRVAVEPVSNGEGKDVMETLLSNFTLTLNMTLIDNAVRGVKK